MLNKRFKQDGVAHIQLNKLQCIAKEHVMRDVLSGKYSFETISCPICNNKTDFECLAEKDRYGLDCQTLMCVKCGLLMTNPRMNQDAYNDFYMNEYRQLYTASEISSDHFFEEQVYHGTQILRYILEQTNLKNVSDRKIIEIGCGAGGILKAFKDSGSTVLGMDLGEKYLNYGISNWGLDLRFGTIQNLTKSDSPDIIIYSHVLEHILDLEKELIHIKEICHKSTLIYIEVPGLLNIHNAYNGDFLMYLQNAHTFHFSLRTLKNLFAKYGFELVQGNEYVRAIFIFSDKSLENGSIVSNEFNTNLQYLKKIEQRYQHPVVTKVKDKCYNILRRCYHLVKK